MRSVTMRVCGTETARPTGGGGAHKHHLVETFSGALIKGKVTIYKSRKVSQLTLKLATSLDLVFVC